MPASLTVAACEYPVTFLHDWSEWEAKLRRLCQDAVRHGARLLVFPEYAAMELTSLLPEAERRDLAASLRGLQPMRDDFVGTQVRLAAELGVTIVAGSIPWQLDAATFRNRAVVLTPDGRVRWQDKIQMTRFEREEWIISGGRELQVFDTPQARIGVLICYDAEFPLLARQLAERGADVLVVPACTDTAAGWNRVMLSCRARALEQQCFAVHAPLCGTSEWSPAIDVNVGTAGLYSPVDLGFPDDGIIAQQAPPTTAPWLVAELNLAAAGSVRRHGQVRNFADWPGQLEVRTVT